MEKKKYDNRREKSCAEKSKFVQNVLIVDSHAATIVDLLIQTALQTVSLMNFCYLILLIITSQQGTEV